MIGAFISLYLPSYPSVIVYMLQSTEYRVKPYLKWYWRTANFSKVTKRRQLEPTKAAKLLMLALYLGILLQILIGISLIFSGRNDSYAERIYFGLAIILAYPIVWAHLVAVPISIGRAFIVKPKENRLVKESHKTFAAHKAVKIAVAGSYGKTTMKELLFTVLSAGKKVAATPANKNVSVSHANFAKDLKGDEEVLIIEYGEGAPGDVPKFVHATEPNIGIITGLAPAHLDRYKSIQRAGEDIFYLAENLKSSDVYVNGESPESKPFIKKDYNIFGENGALGWKVSKIKVNIDGTSFVMSKGSKKMEIHSQLLGRHLVGPLVLVCALADKLGLSAKLIETGASKTKPFEHRMNPYQLGGAWVIDDTYNGNIEGMKAGLNLLSELKFKRKIYVTPGLVDQGPETKKVHIELGKAIASANPDKTVLMKNSVTKFITEGLKNAGYKGELSIETNPVKFYTSLDQFVASGDLVVMQNDWTDNYN